MIVSGSVGIAALGAKLLAMLKAGKIGLTAAKAALAAKKAAMAAKGAGAVGKAVSKVVPFVRGAQGTRMANPGFLRSAIQRAGYQGPLDVGLSIGPDLAYAGIGFATQPGDIGDKTIAAGSQLLLGGIGAGAIRSAVNPGRLITKAKRAEGLVNKMRAGEAVMDTKRLIKLQDQAGALRGKAGGIGQAVEMGVMLPGGYLSYDLAQNAMKAKDKILGGEGLTPTEKLMLDDEMAREEQIRAAYQAGQSAGGQGAFFYDPYTGEVPQGGNYGY